MIGADHPAFQAGLPGNFPPARLPFLPKEKGSEKETAEGKDGSAGRPDKDCRRQG
jgi:hypothetical protein